MSCLVWLQWDIVPRTLCPCFNVLAASVAQSDALLTGDQEVAVSIPPGQQHSFVGIDHEIFSKVILSLPLIQEGQLSVSG